MSDLPTGGQRQDPDVSVVVPVYGNAGTLRALHDRLHRVLQDGGHLYEILFVNDACPAGSLAVLRQLAGHDPRVAVLSLAHNVGQHAAVLTGVAYARGRHTIVMDADLQDPPESIPRLLDCLAEGYAAVFAGRRGQYESRWRLFTSRVHKLLLHFLCAVPADAGMFFAMNGQLKERLLAFETRRPYVVAMIGCTGLPLASIPVSRAERPQGQSAYTMWKRLKTAGRALAWTCRWKLQLGRPGSGGAHIGPVAECLGERFSPHEQAMPLGGRPRQAHGDK